MAPNPAHFKAPLEAGTRFVWPWPSRRTCLDQVLTGGNTAVSNRYLSVVGGSGRWVSKISFSSINHVDTGILLDPLSVFLPAYSILLILFFLALPSLWTRYLALSSSFQLSSFPSSAVAQMSGRIKKTH